jgi:hypothetical protein
MMFPTEGFASRGIDEEAGCVSVPDSAWVTCPGGHNDVSVMADGPSGSGRYWNITVAVADTNTPKSKRGICVGTSTIGWRTLQYFNGSALRWVEDLDKDGTCELILWGSFPLGQEATHAEYGLIGWVYGYDGKNTLRLNQDLTKRIASQLAEAYRGELLGGSTSLKQRRMTAARLLDQFAGHGQE